MGYHLLCPGSVLFKSLVDYLRTREVEATDRKRVSLDICGTRPAQIPETEQVQRQHALWKHTNQTKQTSLQKKKKKKVKTIKATARPDRCQYKHLLNYKQPNVRMWFSFSHNF